jgi:elongation factor Ts
VKIQKERDFVTEQARASGKPEQVIEKMIEGRLKKFYQEVVLLEQAFIMDQDKTVSEVVENLSKDLSMPLKISSFLRLGLGG